MEDDKGEDAKTLAQAVGDKAGQDAKAAFEKATAEEKATDVKLIASKAGKAAAKKLMEQIPLTKAE